MAPFHPGVPYVIKAAFLHSLPQSSRTVPHLHFEHERSHRRRTPICLNGIQIFVACVISNIKAVNVVLKVRKASKYLRIMSY